MSLQPDSRGTHCRQYPSQRLTEVPCAADSSPCATGIPTSNPDTCNEATEVVSVSTLMCPRVWRETVHAGEHFIALAVIDSAPLSLPRASTNFYQLQPPRCSLVRLTYLKGSTWRRSPVPNPNHIPWQPACFQYHPPPTRRSKTC